MFNQSTYSVYENAGPVQPVVLISEPLSIDITVQIITIDGSATGEYYSILVPIDIVHEYHVIYTGGLDYVPGPYPVSIPAGNMSASFNISIIDDDIPENVETFVIAINSSSLPNGVTIANPAQAAQADRPARAAQADSSGEAIITILGGEFCI